MQVLQLLENHGQTGSSLFDEYVDIRKLHECVGCRVYHVSGDVGTMAVAVLKLCD